MEKHASTVLTMPELEQMVEDSRKGLEKKLELPLPHIPAKVSPKSSSVLLHALSGTAGSLLAELLIFPVDTMRLRVQTSAKSGVGMAETLRTILTEQGVGGLYQGISGSVIKESIHSLNFWIWHGLIFRFASTHGDTSRTTTMRRLLLNLFAKQLNWLCTVPFEVTASVNQLTPGSPGLLATARELYSTNGIGVFYQGLTVSLALAVNPAIMNTVVTSLLSLSARLRQARGEDYEAAREHSAATMGMATALAKTIATLITYPLIRCKVLQQTTHLDKSLSQIFKMTMRENGVRGMYQGILAMSVKTVVWNALMMAFKHILGPKREKTPQASPELSPRNVSKRLTLFGREPFPAELVTVERLEEMMQTMHMSGSNHRVERIEQQVVEVSGELREMRLLLKQLVDTRAPEPISKSKEV